MKNILIIHTGGTFGMMPMHPSRTLAPADIHDQISRYVPEVEEIANIRITIPFNLDSSNMTPGHWKMLAMLIDQHQSEYDGFVVIHGTDTMAYTASALSFMLMGFQKPVILTGAQRPLSEIRTDARNNLINSVEIATKGKPMVAVFFGYYLFRGNRCTKTSVSRYDAFVSPNFPPLAEVGIDIHFNKVENPPFHEYELFTEFSRKIQVVHLFPGMSTEQLEYLLSYPDSKAIILRTYGAGNIPVYGESFIPVIRKAIGSGKIIAVSSQASHGMVMLDLYDCGKQLLEAGALSCRDLTIEAAITKLMYLLGKYGDETMIRELFNKNLAGEVTEESELS